MITGRIIRIISKKQVILNIGAEDGVTDDMRFGVYTPVEEITDPDSGEVLGTYSRRKVVLELDRVDARFSIASQPYVFQRTTPDLSGLVGERKWPDLPIREADIQPLPSGTTVRVGDTVQQEVEG